MIETMALHIATGIKRLVPEHPASIAVLKHALGILINTFMIIGLCIFISKWIGTIPEMLMILVAFPGLRMVSGGIHLKSGMKCVLITTAAFVILSLLTFSYSVVVVLNILNIILVFLFAPSDIEKQSRIKSRHYPKLKLASTLIVAINLLIGSPTLAVSFLLQALTLVPWKEVK
ncbi:accessory gene regulator B [Paenibacillus shirakamiensis]|uniref:Accessory gene regulator B n=1 Tax=Paenibacillus shirakamiensis TaxID=1265935 RepID=A0ABS4JCN9_9BACL|nr:accessory gene regulator B family protein [Paenibacillus shirakamiensis]MBP1999494.1 accessory gene regulator B [Paenibacillus shirakamiensis]